MADSKESNFNNIIRQIIKKSLFTERQIEIILNQKDLLESKFTSLNIGIAEVMLFAVGGRLYFSFILY